MNLNESKQAAYSAASRAHARIKTMMPPEPTATLEDAVELVHLGEALTCAAREIEARLKGIAEPPTD
jgi:hypothetical protein